MSEPKKCSATCCELPDHLKEEILARLPLECLCRFRIVCKQWNALISSTKFITQWADAPPNRKPWLVVCNGQSKMPNCMAYCFFTKSWKKTSCISFSFIAEEYAISMNFRVYFGGSSAGLFLLTIFRSSVFGSRVVIVCNPLTRTSLKLPPKSSKRSIFTTGIVGGQCDSIETYKVVAVGHGQMKEGNIVEIYDSSEKSWSIAGHLPRDVEIPGTGMVFCDGSFYCKAVSPGGMGITGFNVKEGTSIFALLPKIACGRDLFNTQLLACGLRVLVAGGIVQEGRLLHEVIIWEFEKVKVDSSTSSSPSSSSWKEIAKMPPSMCNELDRNLPRNHIFCPFKCVAVGDCVCFVLYRVVEVMDVIVYCLSEKTWSWLPSCPLDHDTARARRAGNVLVTAFEPRLDMKVG